MIPKEEAFSGMEFIHLGARPSAARQEVLSPFSSMDFIDGEALYQEYGPALLRYAYSVSRNRDHARDAVQEAFLRYYAQRSEGVVIQTPRAWLYKVIFNYVMDAAANPSVPLDRASRALDPSSSPQEKAEANSLHDLFAQILSPREFTCVKLRADGLSYEEIGAVLGVQVGTVGAMLNRAVRKIKEKLYRP